MIEFIELLGALGDGTKASEVSRDNAEDADKSELAAKAAPRTPLFSVSARTSFTSVGSTVHVRNFMCFLITSRRTLPALAKPPPNIITSGSSTLQVLIAKTAKYSPVYASLKLFNIHD